MASNKTDTAVIIDGKVYTLSGYESPDYVQKIATYLNGKTAEFSKMKGYDRLTQDYKNVLMQINIADDYFQALEEANKAKEDIEAREKELYDLKHELVGTQMKLQGSESRVRELEKKAQEDEKKIIALETEKKTREEDQKKLR